MRRGNVRRNSDKVPMFDRLVRIQDGPENQSAPFETYRDLLMFAACVGYANDQRIPFDKTEHTIAWEQFSSRSYYEGLIYMLGIAVTSDTIILSEENNAELIRTFEEYTNGGLEIIADWLHLAPTTDVLDVFATRILSELDKQLKSEVGSQKLVEPTF